MSEGVSGLCVREAASPSGLGEGLNELCEPYRSLPGKGVWLLHTALELPGGPRLCAAVRPRREPSCGALGHRAGSRAAQKTRQGGVEKLVGNFSGSSQLAHRYC